MPRKPIQYLPLIIASCIILAAALVESFLTGSDVLRYGCYANVFWFGDKGLANLPTGACQFLPQTVQLHTFPIEYPPLSLVVFSLPLILPYLSYSLAFAIVMAIVVGLIYWVFLRFGPPTSAVVFAILLLLSSFATVLTRFDIVPAGLTLICLILAERKRWTFAYIALALGVLIKLYPIMLLPFLFLAEQRDRISPAAASDSSENSNFFMTLWKTILMARKWYWGNGLIFLGLIAGVTALFGLLNFKGAVLGSTAYFLSRPFQSESSGAVMLWLASLFGTPVAWEFSFGSLNIISPISDQVSQGFLLVFYGGYLCILLLFIARKMDLKEAFLASLLVGLATSKIFSPQYMIWLLPILAYNGVQGKFWWYLWGGISILTSIIYPGFYALVGSVTDVLGLPHIAGFMQVITSRNELFILATLAYVFNWLKLRKHDTVESNILLRWAAPIKPSQVVENPGED